MMVKKAFLAKDDRQLRWQRIRHIKLTTIRTFADVQLEVAHPVRRELTIAGRSESLGFGIIQTNPQILSNISWTKTNLRTRVNERDNGLWKRFALRLTS